MVLKKRAAGKDERSNVTGKTMEMGHGTMLLLLLLEGTSLVLKRCLPRDDAGGVCPEEGM